jgi:hypothetical protein
MPRPILTALAVLACSALGACADLPSGPHSFVREAAGTTWVAVVEPAGLPTARTWLAAVPAGAPEGEAARATLVEAARVRRAGDLESALALEDRAALEAATSLSRAPEPQVVLAALAAVDAWAERAAVRTAEGRFPALALAERAAREGAAQARAHLAAGDTLAAVREVTRAAEKAHAWAPLAVALRAVRQAEGYIERSPAPSPELQRARHLLRGAREGVALGDHTRAMQRAMYALQLIEQDRRR